MLTFRLVDEASPLRDAVEALYNTAFPANELIEFSLLMPGGGRDGAELVAWLLDGAFCGFISLLTLGDITHILYFAMEEGLRGRGLGSEALRQVAEMKKGQRIIADLERAEDGAANADQRLRRQRFYQRCGYRDSGVGYTWRGESYNIYLHGPALTEPEFWAFWRHYMK